MKPGHVHLLFGVLWGVFVVLSPTAVAQAATNVDSAVQSTTQNKPSKKVVTRKIHGKKTNAKSAVVKPIGPTDPAWGETLQQRVERLTRECRGRPNSGACEGFSGS